MTGTKPLPLRDMPAVTVANYRRLADGICPPGSAFASRLREAANIIERLEWERSYAIRWANESVTSVQAALFPCRDLLEELYLTFPTDSNWDLLTRAREALIKAGGLA